jgi:hypothetical protein
LEERVKKLHFGHIRTFQTLDPKNRACWERERKKLHFGQIGHSKLVITRIGPVGREGVKKLHFGQIGHSNWTCWKTDRQTDRQRYSNARAQSLEEGMAARLDSTWDFGLIAFKR